jgi:hypothetical protein
MGCVILEEDGVGFSIDYRQKGCVILGQSFDLIQSLDLPCSIR